MDRGIITPMAEQETTQALVRLMTWLSPAFPIGAFSYSGGLEQAIHDRTITDAPALAGWLRVLITDGSGWNDAVLLAESYRAVDDTERLLAVKELATALAGARERHLETTLQGEAFLAAAVHWPNAALDCLAGTAPYPVAVGAVAGLFKTGVAPAIAAYLHAQGSNSVSVAIRCGLTGQRDGVGILATLEPVIGQVARKAASSTLDDLGSATLLADIAALKHETLHSRLFRS